MSEIKTLEMPKVGGFPWRKACSLDGQSGGDDFTRAKSVRLKPSKINPMCWSPLARPRYVRMLAARVGPSVSAVLATAADASVSDAELDRYCPATAKTHWPPGPEAAAPDGGTGRHKPASVVSPPSNSPEPPVGQIRPSPSVCKV